MIKGFPQPEGEYIRAEIDKYRQEHSITEPEEIKKAYSKNDSFLEEELLYVKTIRITNKLIPYLQYFPNLTDITIDCEEIIPQKDIQNIINQYPNLKRLSISEQSEMQSIDVSALEKLQDLEIKSNGALKTVIGIDKIKDLWSLTFYDNQVYSEKGIQDLVKKVCSPSRKFECNFDALYMPEVIDYIKENNINIDSVDYQFKWKEHLKSGVEISQNDLEYSTKELYLAYRKASEIVEQYIEPTDTAKQKYAILYQWMCENVTYDNDALKDKSYMHSENGLARGRKGGTNGSINALLYGSCVCQGYSKTMQMLLKLSGISAFDIGCIVDEEEKKQAVRLYDGKKHADNSNHSILKVNLDGKIYYSDVTWDANRFQKGGKRQYFLLSKEDISKDHKLIGENETIDRGKSISNEEQEKLFSFSKDRLNRTKTKSKRTSFTQKLGKETLDMQQDTETLDNVEKQMEQQEFEINQSGEIIRKGRTAGRFDIEGTASEYATQTLNEFIQNLDNGNLDDESKKKKEDDFKVEKGDDDYIR